MGTDKRVGKLMKVCKCKENRFIAYIPEEHIMKCQKCMGKVKFKSTPISRAINKMYSKYKELVG